MFTRHGLKLRTEKTEVLHVGHHREGRAEHRAGGEETVSGDSFVYLGGAVCGDGKTERGVRRKVHA